MTKTTLWQKIPKRLKITTPILIVLLLIGYFALGWIVANKFMAVNPQKVEYDQTIEATEGDTYTIKGSAYNVNGVMGGIRNDGSMIGIYSAPQKLNDASSTSSRTLDSSSKVNLSVGEKISLQGNIWTTDPLKALSIPYQDVTYTGPLGNMTAWLIRPTSSASAAASTKWTIGVHGIGADKTEMLRFVKPVLAANNSMMVINYRNDTGNPRSPDGRNHLGDTEWQDLQAAVSYAKEQGATDIRLYGDSLGGSIVENYLARSKDTTTMPISRVILDSPALDWKEVITAQITRAGYPSLLYYPTNIVLAIRGIHLQEITTTPSEIKHKTLIVHNDNDKTVPQSGSKRLAAARPDLVTLVDFGDGGHLRAWNFDQKRYEQLVTDYLSQ